MSKKVLIFSPGGLDLPGGVTRMVRYFTEAWAAQPDAPEFEIVDSRGSGSALWSPFYLLRAAVHLLWQAWHGRVSLVHVNYGGHLSALRKSLLILLASGLGIPTVLHLHGGVFDDFYRALPRPLRAALRASFRQAGRVIVLGDSWRDFVIKELHVPADRVVVLPNAVPAPAARGARRSGPCRILFLGELSARKGLPELFAAFADPRLVPLDWNAVVAGNGDVDDCRRQAAALGLANRVSFPGWVDAATVARLLSDADILVLPSHGEGLPMSVLEAMSHALAIVTTPVGSIAEAVNDGESALFVPVGDAAALAAALVRLIAAPELRVKLGRAAQAQFAARFEVNSYARQLAVLYRDLLRETSLATKDVRG